MNQLTLVAGLMLCSLAVQAAFQDFVIGPESHTPLDEQPFLDEDGEQDLMVSFQDVERDGVVDTNLLMKALMQHAQLLGMSLEDLANINLEGEEEAPVNQLGCSSGQEDYNYQERPTWRDVLFN